MAIGANEKAMYLGQLLTTVDTALEGMENPRPFDTVESVAEGVRHVRQMLKAGIEHVAKANKGPLVELEPPSDPATRVAKSMAAWQKLQTRFAENPDDIGLEEMDRAWTSALQAVEEWELAQ